MTQKRKVITALDLTKIIRDEQKYIEANFGQRAEDNDATLGSKDPNTKDDQSAEVRGMEYYFNLDNCAYDFYHDIGTMTDFDDTEPGYKVPAPGNSIPCYGAIIPAEWFHVVEKISKMRFAIPVHIQFYEEAMDNLAVSEEIILLYSHNLSDAKQVAKSCECDFINWIEWGDHRFVLLSAIEKDADGLRDFA